MLKTINKGFGSGNNSWAVLNGRGPLTHDGVIIRTPDIFYDKYREMFDTEEFEKRFDGVAGVISIEDQNFNTDVGHRVGYEFHKFTDPSSKRHNGNVGLLVVDGFHNVPQRVYLIREIEKIPDCPNTTWYEGRYLTLDVDTQEEIPTLVRISISNK